MKLQDIYEARDKDLDYATELKKGEIDKVIVSLEGNKSGTMTKLAKRFKEIDKQLKQIEKEHDKVKDEAKDIVSGLFDAEDEVYTRVVRTASLALTLSKSIKHTSDVVDYEKIANELISLLDGELLQKAEEIKKKYTILGSVQKATPKLSVKVEESKFTDFVQKVATYFDNFAAKFKNWGKEYDKKLDSIEKQMQRVPVTEEEKSTSLLGNIQMLSDIIPSGAENKADEVFYRTLGKSAGRLLSSLVFVDADPERFRTDNRAREYYFKLESERYPNEMEIIRKGIGNVLAQIEKVSKDHSELVKKELEAKKSK